MRKAFIAGMAFGFILTLMMAGEDYSRWNPQPLMYQEPSHPIFKQCYVGTDGLLHESPQVRLIW